MTLGPLQNDVAPCGACRPWIFLINGVLCFFKMNGSGMEKVKTENHENLKDKIVIELQQLLFAINTHGPKK